MVDLSEGVLEWYMARHGETIENKKRIIQGQIGGSLSAKGWEDVEKFGQVIRDKRLSLDKIISGTLRRQEQTTYGVMKTHTETHVDYTDLLQERGYGWIEARSVEEVGLKLPQDEEALYCLDKGENLPERNNNVFSQAESLKEVQTRARKVYSLVKEEAAKPLEDSPKTILTIGSKWINSYIVNEMLQEGLVWHDQANASAHRFLLDKEGRVLDYELENIRVE